MLISVISVIFNAAPRMKVLIYSEFSELIIINRLQYIQVLIPKLFTFYNNFLEY